MPDPITPRERALIEAFPEDRIQRLERGVTGETTYRFDVTARQNCSGALRGSRTAKDAKAAAHRVAMRHRQFAALKQREEAEDRRNDR